MTEDRIMIRDLEVRCIIGTRSVERKNMQKVVMDITLCCDFSKAAKSDQIEDTVNYKELKDEILEMAGKSEFFLLERLAEEVANIALSRDGVRSVTLAVYKPGALTGSRTVGVEITRSRQN